MKLLLLKRDFDTNTIGTFYHRKNGGFVRICYSIEREWLNNAVSISCIPEGTYKLQRRTNGKYFRAYSKRWGHEFVLQLEKVPNRTAILIHAGRGKVDSRGCIVTSGIQPIEGDFGKIRAKGTSRTAYCKLYDAVKRHNLTHIRIGGQK